MPRSSRTKTRPKKAKNDWLRQSIARVIGRKPHHLPHFVQKYKGRWIWHLGQWCKRTGYAMLYCRSTAAVPGFIGGNHPKRWVVIGTTRKGGGHAVAVEHIKPGLSKVIWNGGIPLKHEDRLLLIWKSRA